MRFLLSVLFLIITTIYTHAQLQTPIAPNGSTGNEKLSSINERYLELKSDTSAAASKAKKTFDRWYYNNSLRMHIENDSTYSMKPYSETMKSIVQSSLFCNSSDVSNWENVGPKQVDQNNGWVSAVYVSPSNPDEMLIGARIAGIFKTIDGGQTWRCVTDSMDTPVLGIQQIISSPFDANIMLAVTGSFSGLDTIQNGYLYSSDAGDSWQAGTFGGINDMFRWFSFDPNVQGRVYLALEKKILYSNDDGQNWNSLNLPFELSDYNARKITSIFVSDNSIFIVNSKFGVVGMWKGAFITGINLSINWDAELSTSFDVNSVQGIVSPNYFLPPYLPLDFPNISNSILDYKLTSQYSGCVYDTTGNISYPNYDANNPSAGNQPYNGYQWQYIKTDGWDLETIVSETDKLTCYNTGQATNLTYNYEAANNSLEVVTIWSFKRLNSLFFSTSANPALMDLNFVLPKGVKLKLCVSPYKSSSTITNIHKPNTICNIPDFDYNELFSTVLYESAFALSDTSINTTLPFVVPNNFLQIASFPAYDSQVKFDYYFILEFDSTYDNINLPKFMLNNWDIRFAYDRPDLITVSNIAGANDSYFYLHAKGSDFSTIYRTIDGGNTFDLIDSSPAISGAFLGKDELIASINDSNVYYHAFLNAPVRFNALIPGVETPVQSGNPNGHHADYRASYISSFNGEDIILWGNDGGIAKTINASSTSSPLITSLNGDIAINMIYNLDVHEKTNIVEVGLQDNGTRAFYPDQSGWSSPFLNGGDGSIVMIRASDTTQFIVGDPQGSGIAALKDSPDGTIGSIVSNNVVIKSAEAYLGMRLEEFRFDDTRFVVGLQRNGEFPTGKIIINEGQDTTTRVLIPNSSNIGAIAISQRNPDVIFLANGTWKGDNAPFETLFKTTNGGLTSSDWTPIDPSISYTNDNGQPENKLLSQLVPWDYINALAVDDINPNLLYAGLSGVALDGNNVVRHEYLRVLKSTNGGLAFIDWSEGLPALPVNYLLAIESANHLVFCATDAGIYYRTDNTDKWECFSDKLPKTRVTDLSYNYCSKELYASTYGRGVWRTSVNIDTQGAFQEEITATTTWNTSKDIQGDLVIKSGTTLFINNSTIYFDADRKIIIEPNAKLIMNNATLTNNCGAFWKGIEVWGNYNQQQYGSNQGTLIMNNATIENAREAVRLWEPDNWSSTGGIIRATNSTFRNNILDVELIPYDWELNGIPQPNRSEFNNCSFETNDNFLADSYFAHVTLYKVYGVNFFSCDFTDTRVVDLSRKGRGILSIDAKYKVLGKPTGTSPNPISYYDDALYDVGTFYNLKSGIEAMDANTQNTITVDHISFLDCKYGVRISQVDNAILSRNKFDRTSSPSTDWIGPQYHIYTNTSSAYSIEGNEMTNQYAGGLVMGVTIKNSGFQDNEVYKNKLTDLSFGSFSAGKNRNNEFVSGLQGLEFLCNQNTGNSLTDELILGKDLVLDGAKLTQGTLNDAAGNTFSTATGPTGVQWHLRNNLSPFANTDYFWFNNPNEEPTLLDGSVTEIEMFITSFCPTNFTTIIPGPTKPIPNDQIAAAMRVNFDSLANDYTTKKVALTALEANGNRAELYDAVTNLSWWTIFPTWISLHNEAPYLSEEIMRALGNKKPWEFPSYLLMDLVIENIEVAKNPDFMNFLLEKEYPMHQWYYQQIVNASKGTITERGIKQAELSSISRDKNRIANALIKNIVQDTLGVDPVAYNEWIIKRGDVLCELQLLDNYLDRGQKTSCAIKLTTIDGQIAQLAASRLKTELQDYRNFKNEMLGLTKASGTLQGLDSISEPVVRYYAENATGYAQVQAQNLLCFFRGECMDAPLPTIDISKAAILLPSAQVEVTRPEESVKLFTLYPNPAQKTVMVELQELAPNTTIKLVDIGGKVVYKAKASSLHTAIDVSSFQKGVYLVFVLNDDVVIDREKLIIQ